MYFSRETRSDFGESSCEITASQFPAFPALNSQSALLKKTIKLVFCKWDAYESLRHIVYRLWFACNWGMWIEINQTQQNCKIVHYGLQTEKNRCMYQHSLSFLLPEGKRIKWQVLWVLSNSFSQTARLLLLLTCFHGPVVLSVVLKKHPSFCLCLYTTPAMSHCPLLCPFVGTLTVSIQRCCSKSVGGFSSGHCHWQGSGNKLYASLKTFIALQQKEALRVCNFTLLFYPWTHTSFSCWPKLSLSLRHTQTHTQDVK